MLPYKIMIGSNEQCLQNFTLSTIPLIPLIWMAIFFKVVANYMVILTFQLPFSKFHQIIFLKHKLKCVGILQYTFLARWSLISTKILPHISKTLFFKITSLTNFCSINIKISLIFLIKATRIWLFGKKINTWTLLFSFIKNFQV
jgi:hypothetical protein